eukprot:jgi/Picsp_1/4733/NSC_02102-R1_protein
MSKKPVWILAGRIVWLSALFLLDVSETWARLATAGSILAASWLLVTSEGLRPRDRKGNRREKNKNRRAFGVSGQMSGTSGSVPLAQPGSQPKSSVDWREQVGSEAVCAAWENLAGAIVQEFIYDSWYSHLTPDTQFPAEVRALLNSAFGRLSQRAKSVEIRQIVSEICELFMEHLDLFRDTREVLIRQGEWSRAENEMDQLEFSLEIDNMIRDNLLSTGNLHPALENGHYYVLKDISEGVVYHLVGKYLNSRLASRAVARELLAGCVFRPLIRFCSPYHWTKGLLALLRRAQTRQNEIDRSQSKEDALYGVWCMASKIKETIEKEQAKVPVTDHVSQDDDDEDDDDDDNDDDNDDENTNTPRSDDSDNTASSPVRDSTILDDKFINHSDHLVARIVNAELNTDGARDFVVYKIRVGDASKEWTICRRYRQFEVLHRQLRQIAGYDCQLPGKRFFFHSPNVEFIEQRRCALDDYLQSILQNPTLKASDDLWEFLRQDSEFEILTEKSKGKIKHTMSSKVLVATEMVGRGVYEATLDSSYQIKKHAKTGVENVIKGVRTLSQGKKKTKKSVKKLRIMQDRHNVNESQSDMSPGISTSTSVSEKTMYIEENDLDKGIKCSITSIQTPIYDMLDCIFQLQTRGFFRRQVFSVGRQILSLVLGDAVEEYLSESLDFLRQESTISQLIHRLQTLLWPAGVWMRRNIPQPHEVPLPSVENYVEPLGEPPEDKDEIRGSMQEALTVGMPFPLARLVGKLAYYDGSRDLLQLLQSRTMTLQLGYCMLETFVYHLFPETKPK